MSASHNPAQQGTGPEKVTAAEQPPAGWVALAGVGPGDEGLLTDRAAELLGQAGLARAPADQAPNARRRSLGSVNVEVSRLRVDGARMAPPKPCAARAPISQPPSWARRTS